MALARWTPFAEMERMQEELERMWQRFGGRDEAAPAEARLPAVDVLERNGNLVVRAELPGLRREDVEVMATADTLTIRGERREETEKQDETYYRKERTYRRFYRALPLPTGVKAEAAQAKFQDGILEITLPKTPVPGAQKVAIAP
jgi:HSP20 family protein